jgi:hypothetical protein
MLGPVGAGKSSFINSILSIGKGRKCALAATGDTGDASWTLDVRFYVYAKCIICHLQMCYVKRVIWGRLWPSGQTTCPLPLWVRIPTRTLDSSM